MEEIICIPVQEVTDSLLDRVEKTYVESFPEAERRDFSLVKELIRGNNPRFKMFALLNKEEYAGFITVWELDEFVYVEHFAIEEAARSGGLGGKALQQYLSASERPVVLEVEHPLDEMSKRRIGFYERLGFRLDNHDYKQPPYRKDEEWLDLYLMSYGEIDLNQSYELVKAKIYKYVYGVTF